MRKHEFISWKLWTRCGTRKRWLITVSSTNTVTLHQMFFRHGMEWNKELSCRMCAGKYYPSACVPGVIDRWAVTNKNISLDYQRKTWMERVELEFSSQQLTVAFP